LTFISIGDIQGILVGNEDPQMVDSTRPRDSRSDQPVHGRYGRLGAKLPDDCPQGQPSGTSQFSRAFRARFGVPPRQYLMLVRQQDLDWHEARLIADGFDQDAFLWRQQGLSGSKQCSSPDRSAVK
jgi:hypothetical protein